MRSFFTDAIHSWPDLLQGGEKTAILWVSDMDGLAFARSVLTLLIGVGAYGFSIGLWQGPIMASYVAIKLPLIIFVTLTINALLNGMMAQLLGSRLSFAQTWFALVTSFSIFGLVVGSLAPITIGMALEMTEPDAPGGELAHRRLLLLHTLIVAFAGLISTWRLLLLFRGFTPDYAKAKACVIALILGNLFVGAQVSFLFRPIFCQPGLPIQFLRPDLFEGNFYESVLWALNNSF